MRILTVIPTHDRLRFLREALDSVASQTRLPDEVVIAGNVGVVNGFDHLWMVGEGSLVARLNKVISASDCDAFIVLGDDDRIKPEFIEKTSAEMEAKGADIVFTNYQEFGDSDAVVECGPWEQLDSVNTIPVTALCRRSVWEQIGGYQEVKYFDWDFWRRAQVSGAKAVHYFDTLFEYRRHAGQMGG